MCGIAGYLSASPDNSDKAVALVTEIVASQYRRGPDYQAVEQIPSPSALAVFGHNRLSIIDLTSAANQPMWDSDHTHCVVFNGEIYNYIELRTELESRGHSFRTRSDTEVILEAFKEWGVGAAERFNGMFALAIFRAADSRMWLIRDRFGVKPLYYHRSGSSLVFASTGTVIAAHFGLGPNLQYVSKGLHLWLYEDDSEATQYEGLNYVPAGSILEVSPNDSDAGLATKIVRYYDLPARVAALRDDLASCKLPALIDRVARSLDCAVELRLRSDVPVGVSLSGGLDSSIIAALLAKRHSAVVGFTFGSPEEVRSEGPLVRELQEKLGIEALYVRPSNEQMVEAFWDCMRAQDAPFPSCSIVAQYLVYRTAREREIKVLLGGQGGDEQFMGYRKFQFFHLNELRQGRRYGEALAFSVGLARMVTSELRRAGEYAAALKRYRGKAGIPTLLCLPAPEYQDLGIRPGEDLAARQMHDATRYSLPTLLRYEDRNSLGNSVESRLPFMDYHVAELGFALPTAVKVRGGYGKWIVREVARGMIPERIRSARYKRGFDVDQPVWIEAGLGESLRTALHDRRRLFDGLVPRDLDIDTHFSDDRLKTHGNALSEAVSLIWLADKR